MCLTDPTFVSLLCRTPDDFIPFGESIIAKWLKLQFVLKGHCHGSTAHPKYAQTWKTVCQQLIKLGVKYDILFITLRYAGHPCFVLKIEGCCIFSNHVALILNVSLHCLF